VSIDAKRRRALGPAWLSFAAQTSIVPFAAIAAGRTRFKPDEIAAWQWVATIITYGLFLGGHSYMACRRFRDDRLIVSTWVSWIQRTKR